MMDSAGILIVGGYGHVGSGIAARLSSLRLASVRLAGRDPVKAQETAARLGCESARIDLDRRETWDRALEGIDIAVACVDQKDTAFPAHVLAKGLTYIDVTASDSFFRQVEALDGVARDNGGCAILSVGLAPGLTNLLVKACVEGLKHPLQARIGILLGLGDAHGPAAIQWTLANFRSTGGKAMPMETMGFGRPLRSHPAIPFGFADQHVVRRTLGLAHASTVLTFEPPFLARTAFPLLRYVASSQGLTKLATKAMPRLRLGSRRAALAVEVQGQNGMRCAYLEGQEEAQITALVAAFTVEYALRGNSPTGVWHVEQILSIDAMMPALHEHGILLDLPRHPELKDTGN